MTDDEVLAELDARPLYTQRHGISVHPLVLERQWWGRHLPFTSLHYEAREVAPERLRCACDDPPSTFTIRCILAATQEDGLCDECRQYCADTADKAETITEAGK